MSVHKKVVSAPAQNTMAMEVDEGQHTGDINKLTNEKEKKVKKVKKRDESWGKGQAADQFNPS